MGTGTTGSLRSSYHTAHRAVQKDDLKSRFVSILSSVLQSGEAAPPPKRTFQKSIASYGQLGTLIKGTGTTGSLRSSYHTARRAVQKDNLKR